MSQRQQHHRRQPSQAAFCPPIFSDTEPASGESASAKFSAPPMPSMPPPMPPHKKSSAAEISPNSSNAAP